MDSDGKRMKKLSASCEKPVHVIPVSQFAERCRPDSTENDFVLGQETINSGGESQSFLSTFRLQKW
jgi:hypothetical protein